MEQKKRTKNRFLFLLLILLGVFLLNGQAMAATQGDVATQLAAMLGLDASSTANAITALTNAGVVPAGGWNGGAMASESFVAALYSAVAGSSVTIPGTYGSPSALVAAAATAAGVSGPVAVNGVVRGGGNRDQAEDGVTLSSRLAGGTGPAAGPKGGGFPGGGAFPGGGPFPGGGSGGGGGGGAVSQGR